MVNAVQSQYYGKLVCRNHTPEIHLSASESVLSPSHLRVESECYMVAEQ